MAKNRCRICTYPASVQFTVGQNGRFSKKFLYCSQLCKNAGQSSGRRSSGVLIILFSFLLIWMTKEVVFFIVTLIGLGYFMIGYATRLEPSDIVYLKNKKQKGYKVTLPLANSDLPPEKEVSVFEKVEMVQKKIYSEILRDDVLSCCHQSARLNDKYCVCGRALEYHAET